MNYPTHEEYAAVFGEYEEAESAEERTGEEAAELQEEAADAVENAEGTPVDGGGAEEAAEPAEATPKGEKGVTGDDPGPNNQQSAEERHRQAAARRERAQQEAEAATLARIEAAEDQVYAELLAGQINPFTGKPITTKAEYRAYQQMKAQQSTNAAMEKAGLDPKMIQQLVQQELAPMKQQMQASQAKQATAEAAEFNRKVEAAKAQAAKNIAAAYDPSIKSFDDILAMPTVGRFNELLQRGNSFEDSFYLANREAIDKRRAEAAYRKGADAGANRQHLSPVQQVKGREPVKVPAGVARNFREAMPGITDAEIAAQYAEYLDALKD